MFLSLNNVTIANKNAGVARVSASPLLFDGTQMAQVIENNFYDQTGALSGGVGITQSYATCTIPLAWNEMRILSQERNQRRLLAWNSSLAVDVE